MVRRFITVSAAIVAISLVATGCTAAAPVTPSSAPPQRAASATATPIAAAQVVTRFAVIGDYGMGNRNAAKVAKLVRGWKPSFIITTGDDYYAAAGGRGSTRYDRSTGAFYCAWQAGITTKGTKCPHGRAKRNAFFPALGNHDYSDAKPGPATYRSYFRLPGRSFTNSSGTERYYDFVEGPIHFFVLNSNRQEPNGISSTSVQARWLKKQLAASTSAWNVVYDHHPPYSSDKTHGSTRALRWPFAAWGADVVLSGHSHTYERIMKAKMVYFVNGLGGAPRYRFGRRISGSAVRYNKNWGAQKVTATNTTLTFAFYTVTGKRVDRYTLTH